MTLQVLRIGDYALALGAIPLDETTVLVAWGDQNCVCNDFVPRSFSRLMSVS